MAAKKPEVKPEAPAAEEVKAPAKAKPEEAPFKEQVVFLAKLANKLLHERGDQNDIAKLKALFPGEDI